MDTVQTLMQPSLRLRRRRSGRELVLTLVYALLGLLALWPTSSMGTQITRLLASAVADSDSPEESQDSAEERGECAVPLGAQRRAILRAVHSIVSQLFKAPDGHDRRHLRKHFIAAHSGHPPNAIELTGRLRC